MDIAQQIAILALLLFFAVALLSGIWKYRHMQSSENHQAPYYVDITHRSALMYSFATLVVFQLAQLSVFPTWLNAVAVSLLVFYFGAAIFTYMALGLANKTENQFETRNFNTTVGMWMLTVGELSGFAILAVGTIMGL